MKYDEAIEWIQQRSKFGIKPGLERMKWFMEKLDHPEQKIRSIHIAGTNGKGSTLSFLRHLLEAHHFSVGSFTSPYLIHFNERISVNGVPIKDKELVMLVKKIKPLCEELEQTEFGPPTEFEVITAMAFVYFAEQSLDYVLLETGLGGRLDSTNIVEPIASIITNIGLDHTRILGNTYEQIASEKAGIIKQGVPVTTAVQHHGSFQVIKDKAVEKSAPIYQLGNDFHIMNQKPSQEEGEMFTFKFEQQSFSDLKINMKGYHQIQNAALALHTFLLMSQMNQIKPKENVIRTGLQKTRWPGRFEVVSKNPLVIIDGAHNKEGVISLIETLKRSYPHHKKRLLFSMMKDKNVSEVIQLLDQYFDGIVFTSFEFERASGAEQLFSQSRHPGKEIHMNWKEAVQYELSHMDSNEIFVISGSLYFISKVRQYFELFAKNMIK
ncbi:dihydrofolate synthase / folylpolyglutamate synthase [Salinibacillus kushneri]|uniref:Dihydrofolate synthase/folylpolyglutamate synthase n=1 Tax=Salinibacillus kushneri TaxID=237682 RepID=A0A1I0JFH4_9BACI|nr:dihydrofolate synthase / folylpolyglutamate synthase [Salinibacillus kushneri]